MTLIARLVVALALACSVALAPAALRAEEADRLAGKKLVRRRAKLAVRQGWVVMSVAWRDVVNAKIREKLLSGLPTVIATRAYLFPEAGDKPISLSVKTCRVVFDLWDEVFHIDLEEAGKRRQTVAVNVEGVLRRCAQGKHLPLVQASSLGDKESYFVGVLIEVNPLSAEMMDRIKRWVARPKGTGAVSPGNSLFGTFVGLFVTHVPDADRVLAFRTQSFVPSALPELVTTEPKRSTITLPSETRAARSIAEEPGVVPKISTPLPLPRPPRPRFFDEELDEDERDDVADG